MVYYTVVLLWSLVDRKDIQAENLTVQNDYIKVVVNIEQAAKDTAIYIQA